jgi:GT2 family glycosyltransferase
VIIDNGSGGGEALVIKKMFPGIYLISNSKNTGYCRANNQGIKYALKNNADYILLLNNDTVVARDFLSVLVNFSEKNNFNGILTPKILYYKTRIIWGMGGVISKITSIPHMIAQGSISAACNKIIEAEYAPGCALFVNTPVLKKAGVLNEAYFAYYEDADLSFRIRRLGGKILALPESIIWHKVSRSTNPNPSDKINSIQSYYLSRNGIIFGVNNLQGLRKIIYIFSQSVIKLPAFIVLKCVNGRSRLSYIKGFIDGIRYKGKNEKNISAYNT